MAEAVAGHLEDDAVAAAQHHPYLHHRGLTRGLPSFHSETVRRSRDRIQQRRRSARPMAYRHAVAHILGEWTKIAARPIPFNHWHRTGAASLTEHRLRLHRKLFAVTERFAPGVMPAPTAAPPAAAVAMLSNCGMCGGDVPVVASGVCEICSAVLADTTSTTAPSVPREGGYRRDVRGRPSPSPSPPSATVAVKRKNAAAAGETIQSSDTPADPTTVSSAAMESEHSNLHTGIPITGAAICYQRRVQFRNSLHSYMGRPLQPIPPSVIADIREQLESSARHLLNVNATEPLERYANVTRVHIISLMRGPGCGSRFSKWHRDSHAIHAAITHQPPPDITPHESLLSVMFGRLCVALQSVIFFLPDRNACEKR